MWGQHIGEMLFWKWGSEGKGGQRGGEKQPATADIPTGCPRDGRGFCGKRWIMQRSRLSCKCGSMRSVPGWTPQLGCCCSSPWGSPGEATCEESRRRGRKESRAGWHYFVVLFRIWQEPKTTAEKSESEGDWHFKLKRFFVRWWGCHDPNPHPSCPHLHEFVFIV